MHLQNTSSQAEEDFYKGQENHLLASLPPNIYQKLAPHFKLVSLKQGERVHEPGDVIQRVYFPITCLFSITITMSDGAVVETGMVGSREMLGINALMSKSATTQTEYTVQVPGRAIEVDAQILRQEFDANQELRNVLLRYVQAFIAQISQTAACNGAHVLEQRFARWLLEVQSRVESDYLKITHEFIANMLGVRRSGVTLAALALQDKGLIQCHRGRIQILDQRGLETHSCECFKVAKAECNRLLGIRHGGLI